MKKFKNSFFVIATILSTVCSVLILKHFDGLLATLGKNSAFALALLCFISCLTTCFLLPTAFAKLQYQVKCRDAFLFSVKRYCFTYMTLPFFIMRFACIDKMLPYISANQIHNPLYHQTLWKECAEWSGLSMTMILIFWVCLLTLNLFGVLRYGYFAVNIASLFCMLPLLYLTLDYALILNFQNIIFTLLVLVVFIGSIVATILIPKQTTPPLRPFFAQAENDDLFWRKKRENERKWRSFK